MLTDSHSGDSCATTCFDVVNGDDDGGDMDGDHHWWKTVSGYE